MFTRRSNQNSGFTLVELMVSVSIVGILSGFSIMLTREYRGRAHDAETIRQIRDAQTALEASIADNAGGDNVSQHYRVLFGPSGLILSQIQSGPAVPISEILPGFVHAPGIFMSLDIQGNAISDLFAYNCRGTTYDNDDNKVLRGFFGTLGSDVVLIDEDTAESLGSVKRGEFSCAGF